MYLEAPIQPLKVLRWNQRALQPAPWVVSFRTPFPGSPSPSLDSSISCRSPIFQGKGKGLLKSHQEDDLFWTNHARLLSFPRIEASNTVKFNTPTTWLSNILWNIIEWTYLVGGFNPSEKYESKWVHLPQIEQLLCIRETPCCTMLPVINPSPFAFHPFHPLHLSRGGIRPLKQLEHPCSQGGSPSFLNSLGPPLGNRISGIHCCLIQT